MAHSAETVSTSMWKAAFLVTIQSFLYGFVFSCFNSCLLTGDNNIGSDCYHKTDSSCPAGTVYNDLNLTTFEASLATSLTVIGGWIGCLMATYPSEKYGRKTTLLANNSMFIIGAALSASGNLPALFVGRFVSGVGVGIASIVVPVLLSELSSQETRGTVTTLFQVNLTFAIFISAVMGYGLVVYVDHGWQYMQAFGAVPSIVMLIFHQSIPESPKWILGKSSKTLDGRDSINNIGLISSGASSGDAYDAVAKILRSVRHPGHDVDAEIRDIVTEAKNDAAVTTVSWSEIFTHHKKAMIIGCGLLFFQAMTGINSVTFYSTTIFGLAGFSPSIAGTACWSFINFTTTIASCYVIDRVGRKFLLSTGTYLMLVSLVALSVILITDLSPKTQGILAVVFVLTFVIGFAMGLGAVAWVIMSEIVPTSVRVKSMSLFLSINWVCNIVISFLTLTAIDELGGSTSGMDDDDKIADHQKKGVGYLYFIFAGFTAAAIVFMTFFVPETKGYKNDTVGTAVSSPLLEEDRKHSGSRQVSRVTNEDAY